MIQREYKKVKVSSLIPYTKNNKVHTDKNVDEIVKSIQSNTYIAPIICDEEMVIIAGHGRKLALDKLGIKEAEVLIISGLSEKQKRDYRLRDNKLTELSEWDFENIKFELDEIDDPELTDLFDEANKYGDDFELPNGEKGVIETMSFTVHKNQKSQIDKAMQIAKSMGEYGDTGNENSNGNAIARVCEIFITNNQ